MSLVEPVKDALIIPRNLWTPLGNGHVGTTPTWLTGFDDDRQAVSASGVSADQIAGWHAVAAFQSDAGTARRRCMRSTPELGFGAGTHSAGGGKLLRRHQSSKSRAP